MNRNNPVGCLIIIVVIGILLAGIVLQTIRLHNIQTEYTARERNRTTYNASNYTITAELYAVKPNGTEIVIDANNKLWEIEGLSIGTHDKLLLEIRNNDTIVHVYTLVYTGSK